MAQSAPHSSKKFPLPVLIFFLVFARSAESQGINYILEACNSELYKSLPTDEAISGKYYTNNQLVDKSSPYAPDLNCSSYIPYPEGGSIVLKFVLFEIEFDPDTAVSASFPCEFDQFSINGENYCGILTGDEKCFHGGTQVNFTLTTDYYTEDLYHGIEIHFDTYSTNQCACMTLATETEDSKQCIFPFVFRDVKYYSCVDDVLTNEMNVNGSFCATETLGNGTLTEAGSCDTSIVDCQFQQQIIALDETLRNEINVTMEKYELQ